MTLTPVKGLSVRLYGGLNESSDENKEDIVNMAAFVGYKCSAFSIGAEYNYMQNASHNKDADQNGYSLFASVKLSKKADLYARYDDLNSKDDWNISKDKSSAIIGAQFKLGKYVKIAPNFRLSMPKDDNADNSYWGYINCYFGL